MASGTEAADKGMFDNFRSFMFSSNITKTSAGYAIGAATADLSKTVTFALLIPCIQMAWAGLTVGRSTAKIDIEAVVEHVLYWFCVLFVAYVLAEVFLSQGILGIKTTLDDNDKARLVVAEASATKAKHDALESIVGSSDAGVGPAGTGRFAPALSSPAL